MLNKVFYIVLSVAVLLPCFVLLSNGVGPVVSAESAVVMNASTGEVVFSKNPYEKMGMASTTKIMTSLIALESGDINKIITVKKDDIAVEGTSIYLKEGDKISIETLVKGMLLESGNDAANVTATAIGGSKDGFATLMNLKARRLGMFSTNFMNPSGLTEEGHYSTAYDMALLGSAAINNERFKEICSANSFDVSFGEKNASRTFYNHNKFLRMYEGALGIKTGFTKASGRCLVTAAKRGEVTYVAVTLDAPDDWNDHIKMMDFAFDNTTVNYVECDLSGVSVDVVGSSVKNVKVSLAKPLEVYCVRKVEDYEIVIYLPRFVYSGVNCGDVSGRVDLVGKNGVIIDSSPLIFNDDAPEDLTQLKENLTLLEKIKNKFRKGLS